MRLSKEAHLREHADIINGKLICTKGYGKRQTGEEIKLRSGKFNFSWGYLPRDVEAILGGKLGSANASNDAVEPPKSIEPEKAIDPRPPINTQVDLANIPDELKQEPRWGLWRAVWRINKAGKGRWEKVPVLSTNKPEDWLSFADAVDQLGISGERTGLGYLMTGSTDMIAFDLDHCIDGGVLAPWAADIVKRLNSYTTLTVSGTGLRIFVRGRYPADWVNKAEVSMEVYSGHGGRFVTLTGDLWPGTPEEITVASPETLDAIEDQYRVSDSSTSAEVGDMPELLEGVGVPDDLNQEAREFLEIDGGDQEDRSAALHWTARCLFEVGLTEQEVLSVLVENTWAMAVAMGHRRGDYDKAVEYLWRHHVCKARVHAKVRADAADFADDAVEVVDTGEKWQVPELITRALKRVAIACDLDVIELCQKIDFNTKVLHQVISGVAVNQTNGKFVILKPNGEYLIYGPTNYQRYLGLARGRFYNPMKLEEVILAAAPDGEKEAAKFLAEWAGKLPEALTEHLMLNHQFGTITFKVDMFCPSATITVHDGRANIVFPHLPFASAAYDEEIVADFKAHWPMLDEFIGLMAAARFAAARKKAYVWLRAESDWGKGFIEGVLNNLGLVVSVSEKEVEKIFTGGPVGRQLDEFKRSWVLLFNEFKANKSELKMLEQSISFSPKNLPVCTAELYLKLFTSAEAVESLVSEDTGVEDQFANRFSLIQPGGNLDARPLFTKSRKRYLDSVTAYVAGELNRMVDEYIALGRQGAADKGDRAVINFHQKYGISRSFERLSTKIKSLCQDHLGWIEAEYLSAIYRSGDAFGRALSPTERAVLDASVVKDEDDGSTELYVKTPAKILSLWLEVTFNQAERGKLTVKSEAFNACLPKVTTVRPRNHGKPVKGRFVCILSQKAELDASDLV